MRLTAALAHAQERTRRPGTWGAVVLFGGIWDLLRWGAMPGAWESSGLLIPFLLGAVCGFYFGYLVASCLSACK